MRILSLNVWQGRLEKILLEHLKTTDVDFACMQETVEYDGRPAGLATSYSTIGKSLRLNHQFFSPLNAMKLGSKQIRFGNTIYSKFPFSKTSTTFTRGAYKDDFEFDSDDYNIRAFQHSLVEIDGKQLHILNHHGHHIDAHKLGDEETIRQIQKITTYITQLDGAVMVCGDFNVSPESESIRLLNRSLRNLSVEYSLKTTRSQLTHKAEVCDYIFVNDSVQVNQFMMDEAIVSDHNALILDFEIK